MPGYSPAPRTCGVRDARRSSRRTPGASLLPQKGSALQATMSTAATGRAIEVTPDSTPRDEARPAPVRSCSQTRPRRRSHSAASTRPRTRSSRPPSRPARRSSAASRSPPLPSGWPDDGRPAARASRGLCICHVLGEILGTQRRWGSSGLRQPAGAPALSEGSTTSLRLRHAEILGQPGICPLPPFKMEAARVNLLQVVTANKDVG
jgi:hypothetical protein